MMARRLAQQQSLRITCVLAVCLAFLAWPGRASAGLGRVEVVRRGRAALVPPVRKTVARKVAIPAVYEERPRQVWHEPIYETRRVLVTVPAKVVTRRVPRYGLFGRVIGHKRVKVIIRPARKVWKTERVLVRPGYYETVMERVLVQPAVTKVAYERVRATPGRWEQPRRVVIHKGRPFGR